MWILSILVLTHLLLNMSVVNSEENCTLLKDSFANSTAEFISCAIYNSRPITMCENCVQQYINILEDYNNMKKILDNETYCIDKFINLDRLQIIQTVYSSSYNLWNDAKCYECYKFENGTLTPNKSIQTTTFNKYHEKYTHCINQRTINDTTICKTCMEDYLNLDNYYTSISNENEKIGVCMDIVDVMNTTRLFWSLKCCKYRKHEEHIFIASTVTVLLVTLLFYVIVQFCSVKKTPTILQQRRFAESLNQPNNEM
jgi:hypothetical protein